MGHHLFGNRLHIVERLLIGPNQETLDNMQSIAEEVMPHFSKLGKIEAAE